MEYSNILFFTYINCIKGKKKKKKSWDYMNMKGFNPKTLTCGAASEKNARPAKKIRNTE